MYLMHSLPKDNDGMNSLSVGRDNARITHRKGKAGDWEIRNVDLILCKTRLRGETTERRGY